MKVRTGLVSNSSSASFTIKLSDLTKEQIELIFNHSEIGKKANLAWAEDEWKVRLKESSGFLELSTWMDNFDMKEYLHIIEVDLNKVKIDGSNYSNGSNLNSLSILSTYDKQHKDVIYHYLQKRARAHLSKKHPNKFILLIAPLNIEWGEKLEFNNWLYYRQNNET